MNTLAYLEYVGARKIIKSLHSDFLTLEELKHFVEEARHAYFFKKMGERNFTNFPATFAEENLLGGRAAKDYFQGLDHFIFNELGGDQSKLNYFYVTWSIEERAMKLYSLYDELLVAEKSSLRLTSILKEEANHLQDMKDLIKTKDGNYQIRFASFSTREGLLFDNFLNSISQSLS